MTQASSLLDQAEALSAAPRRRGTWHSGLRSPKIIVGLAILAFFCLMAIVGPMVAPYNPSALSSIGLQGPSAAHWLGTTQTGQDIFSQVLAGARVSMLVGFVAAAIATVVSVIVGLAGGYLAGATDEVLSALSNVFLVIPALPLVIVLAGYLRGSGALTVAVVIAVTGWAWGARVLRAQTLSIRRRDYVRASRATGERGWRIVLAEILPNQIAVVAAGFLFTVIFAILTEAGLAFLGLGDLNTWSWGTILYWAQEDQALETGAWWWFLVPGLCIALVGTGLALINFGIDEYVNPRLRGTRVRMVRRRPRRSPAAAADPDLILEIRDLHVDYGEGPDAVHAVNGVSLQVRRGEVIGLAGESGSGKSTLAYACSRLLRPPGVVTSGEVIYHTPKGPPVDVLSLEPDELRRFRWAELSIVFQSAMNALNPVLDVRTQLADAIKAHRPKVTAAELQERSAELLRLVGIPVERLRSFPHELSGGMRQRVMIAMALALEPKVVIMDEPTTALDVVMQRQILEQITELQQRFGFAVIFITHDLSLLIELADRIAVMYAGQIAEIAEADMLYHRPAHPYTVGLLESFPPLHGSLRPLSGIPGSPPDLRSRRPGCPFQPRCPYALETCLDRQPKLAVAREQPDGTLVACFRHDPVLSADLPAALAGRTHSD
jgi:peptide/nickel transport system permease protein